MDAVDPTLLLVGKMIIGAIVLAGIILVTDHYWPPGPHRPKRRGPKA